MSEAILNQHKRGRKSNAQLARVRALIAQAVSDADWILAFSAMLDIIKNSQDSRARVMACRLLCEYAFGKPVSAPELVEPDENDLDQWGGIPPDVVGADRLPYLVTVRRQRPRDDAPDESTEPTACAESTETAPNSAPIRSVKHNTDSQSIAVSPSIAPAAPQPRPFSLPRRTALTRPGAACGAAPATAIPLNLLSRLADADTFKPTYALGENLFASCSRFNLNFLKLARSRTHGDT